MWRTIHLVTWVSIALTTGRPSTIPRDNIPDKHPLADFITKHGFPGATVGVARDDHLIYADGQGIIRDHHAHAGTLLPVLGVSKLFTAVAILQLVEQDKLKLDDRVFGNHGILYYIRPGNHTKMDSRLKDITVRDLLYHSAGWDESKLPLYDPMLNALYVRKGYNVIDIKSEMNAFGLLDPDYIIHYMVGRNLDYDPGTKRKESNFGYCLLGRIIEEKSDMDYDLYVMRMILKPAGMWHTRMGPSHSDTKQGRYKQQAQNLYEAGMDTGYIPLIKDGLRPIFDIIPAEVLDSSLGWHSNIYDLARFFNALFKRGPVGLLKPETVEALILEPAFNEEHGVTPSWDGIGFTVNADGGFWFMTNHTEVGAHIALYHQGPPLWATGQTGDKDTTLLFIGVSEQPHADLLQHLTDWVDNTQVISDFIDQSAIVPDLADAHVVLGDTNLFVRYQLSEHHIVSYSNALQMAGYVPTWIHGYQLHGHTYFLVIANRAKQPEDLDFVILVNSYKDRLIHQIVQELHNKYQLIFLQTYNSASHDDHVCHVAKMALLPRPLAVEFDLAANLESYFQSEQESERDGFITSVQSVDVDEGDITVTYLMNENPQNTASIKYHDLTLQQLKVAAQQNAQLGFTLSYLDTYSLEDEARFSAVFHHGIHHNWMLQTDVTLDYLPDEISKWHDQGYYPTLMAAYEKDGHLHFAGLWQASSST